MPYTSTNTDPESFTPPSPKRWWFVFAVVGLLALIIHVATRKD